MYEVDCGYFDANGSFEAVAFESEPDGYYYYDRSAQVTGRWQAADGQVCLEFTYNDGITSNSEDACYGAEWSRNKSLLLIDQRNQITAEIFTFDGRQHYADGCNL
jgi:hypothetical protein